MAYNPNPSIKMIKKRKSKKRKSKRKSKRKRKRNKKSKIKDAYDTPLPSWDMQECLSDKKINKKCKKNKTNKYKKNYYRDRYAAGYACVYDNCKNKLKKKKIKT